MKKILVSGATGQLGLSLQNISNNFEDRYQFIFATKEDFDLMNDAKINDYIASIKPDYIINCAAYTAVDKAESETKICMQCNGHALKTIATAANNCNAVLIHLSSDYVYHIEKYGPLNEEDVCHPQGIYAQSKLRGEEYVKKICNKYIILRTSWVFSPYGNNFVKTMLRLAETKKELTIVSDQLGTPTYAPDIAKSILHIVDYIEKNNNFNAWGVYNYSNEGITSWKDFAEHIFNFNSLKVEVKSTTTLAYNAPAPRPMWSLLSKRKIKFIFGLDIRHYTFALKDCLDELREKSIT